MSFSFDLRISIIIFPSSGEMVAWQSGSTTIVLVWSIMIAGPGILLPPPRSGKRYTAVLVRPIFYLQ
jgi:hypothetical protein